METIIRGERAVLEAIYANIPLEILYMAEHFRNRDFILKEIEKRYAGSSIPVRILQRKDIETITDSEKKTGIAAKVKIPEGISMKELVSRPHFCKEKPFFVILDHLEDPHNVGAIIRSAEGSGVHAVIMPRMRSAGITDTVFHTSAGAAFHMPIAHVGNIAQTIDILKKEGIWIFGTDGKGKLDYFNADFTLPLAVIIGSEKKGIKPLVRKKCDFIVKIPLSGKIQSLNASSSAAVIFFEVVRQRVLQKKGSN